MEEPFASSLGTTGLLKHLKIALVTVEKFNDISEPETRAANLLEQLKDLVAVTASLDDLAAGERRGSSIHLKSSSVTDLLHLHSICECTSEIVSGCDNDIESLHSSLEELLRARHYVGYVTPENRLDQQAWFDDIYQILQLNADVLQILCVAINLLYHKNDTNYDGSLSNEAATYASTLQYRIALVKLKLQNAHKRSISEHQKALKAATEVCMHVPAFLNKHFVVGRSAKSFYTGRERQMAKLNAAFDDNTSTAGQKIFVIYGLGGSGKTELALKFAEDHTQFYWGVFFIDGSSGKNAFESYAEIAKIGGVEPNEKAAKNWLRTRALPWLLIIDNADDDKVEDNDKVKLEDLLPGGTKGSIIITSRDPSHKVYGTAGKKSLELLPMEMEEANELILKAANEDIPCQKKEVKDSAGVICKALGFLPLALVHAGKAIMLNLCNWGEYLMYYERYVRRIQRGRLLRNKSHSRDASRNRENDDCMNVFSSYEILYQSLLSSEEERFRDAVELLHLFSYLHFQNIRLDILVNAAINPMREVKEREKEAKEDEELQKKLVKLKRGTWSRWFRELALRVILYLDSPLPLPAALKNHDHLGQDDFEDEVRDRLGLAVLVLVSRSLIMTQDRMEGQYCMHPLVHKWIRERPEMPAAQQALWCQVATTTLARNVLFPPLGDTDEERGARRELLPHIIHVRSCQDLTAKKLKENRISRNSILPALDPSFGRHQALEAARFSRVYSEAGLFKEALKLQSKTKQFATETLGEEHPLTIKITLFMVSTLWELSRTDEGTKLLRGVYDICVKSLGEDDPLTLRVTDLLGSTLCWKGRWSEALVLHERAVEGMTRIYGKEHENTLKATNNLARVLLRYMEWERASELHQSAWEGMKKRLGDSHVDSLTCLEDLAMCRIRLGEKYLPDCHEKMVFVLEQRRKLLGKEQPYTLLAICNLGRVKSAMGHHSEAASIMKEAAAIAERNLGEDHFGVLAGKTHYAQVLVHLEQFKEAEEIFFTVVDKTKYRKSTDEDGEHPDRMIALWYLAGCFEKQHKLREALDICQGLVVSLQEIGGNQLGLSHKFSNMVKEEIAKIKEKMKDVQQLEEENSTIPGEL